MSKIIDTRNLQARLEELEEEIEHMEELNLADSEIDPLREERENLLSLKEEIGDEWDDGVTLIPELDFEDYCRDLVSDIGDLPRDLPSYIEGNINWEGVAKDLSVDYSMVDYDGESYYYRA